MAAQIALSAVVVARDEADMVEGCLKRLSFADEVVVGVDTRSSDGTIEKVRAAGIEPHPIAFANFSQMKNDAVALARGKWILLVDADERVSTFLAQEIRKALDLDDFVGHKMRRDNYLFGRKLRYGPWRERPVRLYRAGACQWVGDIHERLVFNDANAKVGLLKNRLAHFSHRSLTQVVAKTLAYAEIQAQEMYAAGHPRVTRLNMFWGVIKSAADHLLNFGWLFEGMPGFFEAILGPFAIACTHIRLWELQRQPPLSEQYARFESQIP